MLLGVDVFLFPAHVLSPWRRRRGVAVRLPVSAAISKLEVGSVQTTFFLFLLLFTVLLIAEIGIMLKAIRKGVEHN